MTRLFRENGLSIVAPGDLPGHLAGGQTTAGLNTYNAERRSDGVEELSVGEYLSSAHFGEANVLQ